MQKIIDLSHALENGQAAFPGDPKIAVRPHGNRANLQYNITRISMGTHQGTHLDAPFHFYDDGKTVDRIPPDRFIGPAAMIDLAPSGALAPGTEITTAMLEPFERAFTKGARVLYRTGWSKRFGSKHYFTAFPTLTIDAARWIARRRIGLLGMDTPTLSVDWLECHLILLKKGVEVVIVESLTNLHRLPAWPRRFVFVGLPLKIKGRDGSPIRAVAVIDVPGRKRAIKARGRRSTAVM